MNLKELKEIIDFVASKESIEELEIEKSGLRLKIRRTASHPPTSVSNPAPSASVAPPIVAPPPVPGGISVGDIEGEDLFYIKSPIVGTFFQAPSPTSEVFAAVGTVVAKGTIVCIIEAMKLMNEIESEVAGEIVAVLVENGQPVEYGESLFAVKPR